MTISYSYLAAGNDIAPRKKPDAHDAELTGFLEWIMYEVDFKHWYCGHWHMDTDPNDKFSILHYALKEL